jgi:excisionase family DNA binding protein
MSGMDTPLPLPNPGDWMTTAGAAFLLGCSRRTIARLIDRGVLTAYRPLGALDEDRPIMLWRAEVNTVLDARLRLRRSTPSRRDPLG